MLDVRDRLLDATEALVYRNGVNGVGIDTILAEARVAKMSLYKQFGSKEALVVAALERRDERWMMWFEGAVERLGTSPRKRLLAIFDALGEWFAKPDFHGCAFINVAGEFFEADHPIRRVAARHKERLRSYIVYLCKQSGATAPETMARHLFLLVEGAIVAALVASNAEVAKDARSAAERLLAADGRAKRQSRRN